MPSLSEETDGRVERLMPGATIGIIGGGQLGRMMALSARYMGFRIGVLDPTPDCPTAQVADFQIAAEYDDINAIRELAERSSPTNSRTWMPMPSIRCVPLLRHRRVPICCALRRIVSMKNVSSTIMAPKPLRGRQ